MVKLMDRIKGMLTNWLLDQDSVYNNLSTVMDESAPERHQRYLLNWAYYFNRQYDSLIQTQIDAKAAKRSQEILYSKIKPLFNVCTEAVNLDAASVLPQPVTVTIGNPRGQAVVDAMWKRSQLDMLLTRKCIWGAALGDAFWRLANEFTAPEAVLHSPLNFDIVRNPHNKADLWLAESSYNYTDPSDDQSYTYTLQITPDAYYTLRNGKDYAFAWNPQEAGRPLNSWPNPLGFVPVVHVKLLDVGDDYGLSTFQDILPNLDAVNEIASYLAEIIRIHAKPQVVAKHIKAGDLTKGDATKGEDNIWYVNPTGDMARLGIIPSIDLLEWGAADLAGINTFIDATKTNIQEALPEWHLKRVREQTAPSGYSVKLQLTEFQAKIQRMRRAATAALSELNCMAMVAANVAANMESAREIKQEYSLGNLLPNDEAADQALAAADHAMGVITDETYLIKRGYTQEEARKELRAVEKQKEKSAARATAVFGLPEPGADDNADDQPIDEEANADINARGALQSNNQRSVVALPSQRS
jgi:uncharacterized membrane protein